MQQDPDCAASEPFGKRRFTGSLKSLGMSQCKVCINVHFGFVVEASGRSACGQPVARFWTISQKHVYVLLKIGAPRKNSRKVGSRVGYFQFRVSGFNTTFQQANHFVQNTKVDCGDFL